MTKKIAISLPGATLAKARAAVSCGKAPTVSSYVARLIEQASATETFEQMISDWVRESAATDAEIRAAETESRRAFERAGLVPKARRNEKPAPRKAS